MTVLSTENQILKHLHSGPVEVKNSYYRNTIVCETAIWWAFANMVVNIQVP
jgi:hypothetical protein